MHPVSRVVLEESVALVKATIARHRAARNKRVAEGFDQVGRGDAHFHDPTLRIRRLRYQTHLVDVHLGDHPNDRDSVLPRW